MTSSLKITKFYSLIVKGAVRLSAFNHVSKVEKSSSLVSGAFVYLHYDETGPTVVAFTVDFGTTAKVRRDKNRSSLAALIARA